MYNAQTQRNPKMKQEGWSKTEGKGINYKQDLGTHQVIFQASQDTYTCSGREWPGRTLSDAGPVPGPIVWLVG